MKDLSAAPNPRVSWCLEDPLHPVGIKRWDKAEGVCPEMEMLYLQFFRTWRSSREICEGKGYRG